MTWTKHNLSVTEQILLISWLLLISFFFCVVLQVHKSSLDNQNTIFQSVEIITRYWCYRLLLRSFVSIRWRGLSFTTRYTPERETMLMVLRVAWNILIWDVSDPRWSINLIQKFLGSTAWLLGEGMPLCSHVATLCPISWATWLVSELCW